MIQCSIWNELVGGMKLIVNLAVSPPYYSLILLPYITQCTCERTCPGSTLGCLELVCMDDVTKNGGCWKRKKAGGVSWSARVWQQRKGGSQSTRKKSDGWLTEVKW